MYRSISDITVLDLDVTAVCNARCVDCARWQSTAESGELEVYHNYMDPHRNTHYAWPLLSEHITVLPNISKIIVCGNAGDPMAHPHIADIMTWLHHRWPTATLHLDTNGSLGRADTWQALSGLPMDVRFAVDGLADTNHIYRRGVKWSRVVNNIEQWHSLGGDGTLKTIDFLWNHSDRPKIKAWAEDLGWQWQLDERWHPGLDHWIYQHYIKDKKIRDWHKAVPQTPPDIQHHLDTVIDGWHQSGQGITPRCKEGGDWIYINHDHTVWPCCYWANVRYSETPQQLGHHHQAQLLRSLASDWNSLDHHPLEHIIQHPVFTGIEQLWQGSTSADTSWTCIHNCCGRGQQSA